MGGRCIVQKFQPNSIFGVISTLLLGPHPPPMWRWATTLGKSAQAVYFVFSFLPFLHPVPFTSLLVVTFFIFLLPSLPCPFPFPSSFPLPSFLTSLCFPFHVAYLLLLDRLRRYISLSYPHSLIPCSANLNFV